MTLVPEVLQLSINSGKKSEQSFFYFTIYFLLQFSSSVGANNNSSVNFPCFFFVDFDVFQISFIYSVILIRASSYVAGIVTENVQLIPVLFHIHRLHSLNSEVPVR